MYRSLNGMKCVDPVLELLLDFNIFRKNGRNIYEWYQINQTILDIVFDRVHQNESDRSTFWRFGISNYYQYSTFRNTFQYHKSRPFKTMASIIDNGC